MIGNAMQRVSSRTLEDRKNRNFTQVYPLGFQRIRQMMKDNSGATNLYLFFAQHIDANCGAVLCDQKFLADEMGVTTRTIIRWINWLEEQGAVLKIPVAGRVCAYALNPNEVWRGYDSSKDYASFATKTLVGKEGNIQRKLKLMASGQQDLPLDS